MSVSILGTHHTGIAVSNLDRMLAFLHDQLGLKPLFIAESSGPKLAAAVGLQQVRSRIAVIELKDHSRVELIEYIEPPGRPFDRVSSDIGSSHICFEVPDIDEAVKRLTVAGAEFFASPLTIGSGGLEGWRFAYLREPIDGLVLELIERPTDKA